MDENTRDQLIDLNRKFYQTFAEQFSATRQRLQPGVIKIIPRISKRDKLLDLGCGNGEFGKELFRRGHRGVYVGIDSNPQLLDIAQTNLAGNDSAYLLQRDLTSPSWDRNLPHNQYEVVSAFAVLHHIPSSALRQLILEKVRGLIAPGSIFIHSEWQFLNSQRLQKRIQPWEKFGLESSQVEPGDYLIDWRYGGHGYRYIHHFTINELDQLASDTGYTILDTFSSDGEGGELGLYQIWISV